MSVNHYSKFSLNTWPGTPYFEAHIPGGYPLGEVLQASRAFRRLPPNLRKLAVASKAWALHNDPDADADIKDWYDDEGNELDPFTGEKLTDEEIDASWDAENLPAINATDIPDGPLPDPTRWKPLINNDNTDGVSEQTLLRDIRSRGRKYVSKAYGIPLEALPGYSLDTVDEIEGEDWDDAAQRFKRRVARVLQSTWVRDHPEDRKVIIEGLKTASLKWDLSGEAEAAFDAAEDHT